jgi:hypothetical protein
MLLSNGPMSQDPLISFGDNVRVRSTPLTLERGLADKLGQVYGETTPSYSEVEVIGNLTEDYAINVFFADEHSSYWFSRDLLEFVNHGAGSEIVVGTTKLIRAPTGEWTKADHGESRTRPWWKIW